MKCASSLRSIADVINHINDEKTEKIQAVAEEVKKLCSRFPLYASRIKG
jgi:glycine/serine hydroxymethyltransferase